MLALAMVAAGCPEKKETPGPSPGSGPGGEATERPSSLRAGVKVPLPQGWSALVAADGSFQAGPPGRPVLRVDVRRGEGEQMPSVEDLAGSIRKQFSEFHVSLDQEEGDEQLALVR